MTKIDIEQVRRLFDYDSESGALIWKERPAEDFKSLRSMRSWNAQHAGKEAGHIQTNKGHSYRVLSVDGVYFKAHRIIYSLVTGLQPEIIDHKNGVGTDNRGKT